MKEEWKSAPLPDDPAKFDENGDGRLSTLDIATLLAKHRQKLGLTEQDQLGFRPMFVQFDKDFDGIVSKQELEQLVAQGANISEVLEKWDIDKHVSKNELTDTDGSDALSKEQFPQIDRIGDGVINRDEMARYLASQSTGVKE
jgi:Ca2+-binding EF-hand superfamily protein